MVSPSAGKVDAGSCDIVPQESIKSPQNHPMLTHIPKINQEPHEPAQTTNDAHTNLPAAFS